MKINFIALFVAIIAAIAWEADAQFNYVTNNGAITITLYTGSGGAVVIPGTINNRQVTTIGDGIHSVFAYTSVSSVTVTNNVTLIQTNAFQMASSITNVIMGTNVTTIGNGAFFYCNGLTSVKIPSSVTNLGIWAFENCNNLNSVIISNGPTSIAQGAFEDCPNLTNVAIPNSVTNIGELAFGNDTSLTNIKLPNSLTIIGQFAFGSCDLTNLTIPASVTSIGSDAFSEVFSPASAFYFAGNEPSGDSTIFSGDNGNVYYLPGATGWGKTFGGLFTVLWNPQPQTSGASFGIHSNQFGFNITGPTNIVLTVDACTNLANPIWQAVQTITLNGGSYYFSDSQWTNYHVRFYRLRSP